jgi:NADPH:quinone reductase-like Zn-dependent oxidoreductase
MNTIKEISNYNGRLQKHLGSGFNSRSTAEEVIKGKDLRGKIVIVTGGNTGIGLETTRVFASAGATVVVPARDVEKAKKNLHGIENVEIQNVHCIFLSTTQESCGFR